MLLFSRQLLVRIYHFLNKKFVVLELGKCQEIKRNILHKNDTKGGA